jgi:hypothetical protein
MDAPFFFGKPVQVGFSLRSAAGVDGRSGSIVMLRKVLASLAAAAVFATTFSPVDASAQRYGYHDRDRHDYGRRHRDYRDRHYRDRDDDGDAVAAGVVGLIVGLAIGSLVSNQNNQRVDCRDNYQRCPPPRYYGERRDSRYDPRYDNQRYGAYDDDSAYAREYGLEGGYDAPARAQCTRRERQWDRYANRYVTVDVPC